MYEKEKYRILREGILRVIDDIKDGICTENLKLSALRYISELKYCLLEAENYKLPDYLKNKPLVTIKTRVKKHRKREVIDRPFRIITP